MGGERVHKLIMKTRRREPAERWAARRSTADAVRRIAIATAGFVVLIFGVALLVVPVPGTSVIVFPLGLAILAREFKWARRLLVWSTAGVTRIWARVRPLAGNSLTAAVIASS